MQVHIMDDGQFARVQRCLPCAPEYRWDWEGLQETVFAPYFRKMERVQQHPVWHGEGNVWVHTRMVCAALAEMDAFRRLDERRQQVLALAALLHDLGKITCTRLEDGVWVSPGHGAAGAQEARRVMWQEMGLCGDAQVQAFREAVCFLIRYHTTPLHLIDHEDPPRRARKLAENGRLLPLFSLEMLCLLSEADVLGRISDDRQEQLDTIQLGREAAREAGCLEGPYPFPSACTRHAYLSGKNVWPQQELFDDSWGEVIMLCGLPGTGKDTWIKENHPDLPVVCLDDIRRRMGIAPTDNQGPVVQAAREEAKVYLRARRPFIWNATNITEMLRKKQLRLFEEYHAAVRIVYLETNWHENLRRNKERKYAVPESAVCHMLEKLNPPEAWEGRSVEWYCV